MTAPTPGYLGVDGGGTSTTAVIVDAAGRELGRAVAGTSNPSVIGLDSAATVLTGVIGAAMTAAGAGTMLVGGWAGLAGFGRDRDQQALRPVLESLVPDLRLTNDVQLVLSGLKDSVGVAVVAGTGSIVAGRNAAGETTRVGGWGHLLGDEGSGYQIGRAALNAVARDIDGRGPVTSLTRHILAELQVTEPYDLIPRVYDPPLDKAAIARLASFPLLEAYAEDKVSYSIVDDAAADLAEMVLVAARQFDFTTHLPLALTGGVLIHHLIMRERLLAHLRETWRDIAPIMVIDPALTAARAVAGIWSVPA